MWKLAVVLCVVAAFLTAPVVASGQGIEAKLGNNTTATFVVKDSNNMEILVLEAKDQTTGSPNIIGGHNSNSVTPGVEGATIGGGGATGWTHKVTDDYGTVGGGLGNQVGDNAGTTADSLYATVGGGYGNTASGSYSTVGGGAGNVPSGSASTVGGGYGNTASGSASAVGGGYVNTASGSYSTVPGGYANSAAGSYSFAAGRQAKADNQGCFVWGDSTDADVTCPADNQWIARTRGGAYFYSNSSLSTGVALAAGGTSWEFVSDRAVKENFTPVDKREILEKVAAMPVEAWNLKSQDPSIRHIGPVAQDFNGAFGYGEEERYINMMDATGVTMAAVQGLYEVVQNQREKIEELEGKARRIEDLEKEVKEIRRLVRGTAASE